MTSSTFAHTLDETPVRLLDAVAVNDQALDGLLDDDRRLPRVAFGLFAVSLLGLIMHGLVVGWTASALPEPTGILAEGTPALWMPIAFIGAFIGTLGVCLPSFWFSSQLAGLETTFRWVSTQALRVQAHASVLLFSTLPLFALAAFWAMLVSDAQISTRVLQFGIVLPFITGLSGVRTLHRTFVRLLARTESKPKCRGQFLKRLVLVWSALYSVVAPVALWRMCEALSQTL